MVQTETCDDFRSELSGPRRTSSEYDDVGGPVPSAERNTDMADWKKVALAAILSDGKIDDNEVKLLKKELWEDNKIDDDEVKFLVELRNAAQKKARAAKEEVNPAFTKLFFKTIS